MNRQSQISNLNLFSIIRGGAEAAGNPAKTDQTGDAYKAVTQMFSRLMPLEMVKSQPDKVLALFLETITNSGSNLNYFLGGNIMNSIIRRNHTVGGIQIKASIELAIIPQTLPDFTADNTASPVDVEFQRRCGGD